MAQPELQRSESVVDQLAEQAEKKFQETVIFISHVTFTFVWLGIFSSMGAGLKVSILFLECP